MGKIQKIKESNREIEDNYNNINIFFNKVNSFIYFEERLCMINEWFYITTFAIKNKKKLI